MLLLTPPPFLLLSQLPLALLPCLMVLPCVYLLRLRLRGHWMHTAQLGPTAWKVAGPTSRNATVLGC